LEELDANVTSTLLVHNLQEERKHVPFQEKTEKNNRKKYSIKSLLKHVTHLPFQEKTGKNYLKIEK
jgi:hypothetical protein